MAKSVLCFLILFIGVHCNVIAHPGIDVIKILETTQNASNIAPDSFVAGGGPAQVGQFPWIVRFRIRDRQRQAINLCGGTLISKRHVLTAAHCVDQDMTYFPDVEIYLGEYDINSFPMDCAQGRCTKNIIMFPDKIMKHAQYNRRAVANDIALLRLQKEAPIGGAVQAIALPPFDIDRPSNDGVDVIVAGWGLTETGSVSDILQTAQLHLMAQEKCLKLLPTMPRGHLCAEHSNGQDICGGDSGGPLMMYYQKKYYLTGVVSFRFMGKCGTSEAGYYTNVYKYMKWIKTNMRV